MVRAIAVLAVLLAFAIDLGLIFWLRRGFRHVRTDSKKGRADVRFLGAYSPVLSWLRTGRIDYKPPRRQKTPLRKRLKAIGVMPGSLSGKRRR